MSLHLSIHPSIHSLNSLSSEGLQLSRSQRLGLQDRWPVHQSWKSKVLISFMYFCSSHNYPVSSRLSRHSPQLAYSNTNHYKSKNCVLQNVCVFLAAVHSRQTVCVMIDCSHCDSVHLSVPILSVWAPVRVTVCQRMPLWAGAGHPPWARGHTDEMVVGSCFNRVIS